MVNKARPCPFLISSCLSFPSRPLNATFHNPIAVIPPLIPRGGDWVGITAVPQKKMAKSWENVVGFLKKQRVWKFWTAPQGAAKSGIPSAKKPPFQKMHRNEVVRQHLGNVWLPSFAPTDLSVSKAATRYPSWLKTQPLW